MTPPKLLLRTLLKELFTNNGETLFVNPSNSAKNEKNSRMYYVKARDKPGSNSPLPGHDAQSNARGMPGGEDVEVSN